jgi:hypothetical protein
LKKKRKKVEEEQKAVETIEWKSRRRAGSCGSKRMEEQKNIRKL